jgi:hypothetical protein
MGTKISEPVVLRCYAYRRLDGKVYAECIDLDIAVVRDTMKEAIRSLDNAVWGHLQAAASQGWLDELVPRPSPLANRLRYRLLMLVFVLSVFFKGIAASFSFYTQKVSEGPNHQPMLA